jgi:ribosomal protein S18 acetylase RimI-like enzyme
MEHVQIREMLLTDYEAAVGLWQETPGLGLSDADSKDNIEAFLMRNKGMSFSAEWDGELIGTVLCGHDGRRGFIYHLAVHEAHRRKHIGSELIRCCLTRLNNAGITKCHLFVLENNVEGMDFWNQMGFVKRDDIYIYSRNIR